MDATFSYERVPENVATTFFKCTRWLLEENGDLPICRYHYFCDSTYPGDYPPVVDLSVFIFAIASYLSVTAFTLLRFKRRDVSIGTSKRRYLLPSGPIALPLVLLILAKGSRINTLFPLSAMGPALHHLVHISALAFDYQSADRSVKYAVLEASTVSGILHASLYLDSIIMPYYTGLEALTKSIFSGDCATCVCRTEALVVGGRMVSYRGWSKTTMAVIATLFSRMLSRSFGEEKLRLVIKMTKMLEGVSWILIARDVVYLMITVPQDNAILSAIAYGGICVLIFLSVLKNVQCFLVWIVERFCLQKRAGLRLNIV